MKSTAIKIIKNGIYGTKVKYDEMYVDYWYGDLKLYCPKCYLELRQTFEERQYCINCKTDVHHITKEEMRVYKINNLINE